MKKINKITNIALIFMLVGVFLCQDAAFCAAGKSFALRAPSHFSKSTEAFVKVRHEKENNHPVSKPEIVIQDFVRVSFAGNIVVVNVMIGDQRYEISGIGVKKLIAASLTSEAVKDPQKCVNIANLVNEADPRLGEAAIEEKWGWWTPQPAPTILDTKEITGSDRRKTGTTFTMWLPIADSKPPENKFPQFRSKYLESLILRQADASKSDKTLTSNGSINLGINEENLIREACAGSRFKTYVVADQLFSLFESAAGETKANAVAISREDVDANTGYWKKILLLLEKASALGLPGGRRLLESYKTGDAAFLKASDVLDMGQSQLDQERNHWGRTPEELTMSLLWHERMHLGFGKMDSMTSNSFYSILFLSNDFTEEGVIYFITRLIRHKKEVMMFIDGMFPYHVAKEILRIWEKARPSKNEVAELRNIAREMAPFVNESDYPSILKDMTGVRGVINKILFRGKIRKTFSCI